MSRYFTAGARLHPDLARFPAKNFRLLFDSDIATNEHVQQAEKELFLRRIASDLRVALEGKREAREVAEQIRDTVRKLAQAYGHKPDIEVGYWTPDQNRQPYGACYVISWEAGPYAWVHAAWPTIMDVTGRLCEPYHSFDLCIYEAE